jgi:hypothetical protein
MKILRAGIFLAIQFGICSLNAISFKEIFNRIALTWQREQIKRQELSKKKKLASWFHQFKFSQREAELYNTLFLKLSQKARNAGGGSEFLLRVIDDIDFSKADDAPESIALALASCIAEKKDKLYIADDTEIKPILTELFMSSPKKTVRVLSQLYFTLMTSRPIVFDQKAFIMAYEKYVASAEIQNIISQIQQNSKLSQKEKIASLRVLDMQLKESLLANLSKPLLGKAWNEQVGNLFTEWGEVVAQVEKFRKLEIKSPKDFKQFVFETPYYSPAEEKRRSHKNKILHIYSVINNLELFKSVYNQETREIQAKLDSFDSRELEKCRRFLNARGDESEEVLNNKAHKLLKANAKKWHPDKYQTEKDKEWATEQMKMVGHAPRYISEWQNTKKKLAEAEQKVNTRVSFIDRWLSEYNKAHRLEQTVFSQETSKYVNTLFKPNRVLIPFVEHFSQEEIIKMDDAERKEKIRQIILNAHLVGARGPKSFKSVELEQD